MKQSEVEVRATITKTYTIDAEDPQSAAEIASEIFSVLEDGTPEDYQEEQLSIKEIEQ